MNAMNPVHNTSTPLITTLKRAKIFTRSIAMSIIMAHLVVITTPAIAAVSNKGTPVKQLDAETELGNLYVAAIQQMAKLKQLRIESKSTDAAILKLNDLKIRFTNLNQTVLENFSKIEADIKVKKLPVVILQRHTEMVSHYKSKNKLFSDLLNKETDTGIVANAIRGVKNLVAGGEVEPDNAAGNSISDGSTVFSIDDFMPSRGKFDPNNLPNKSLQPNKKNKPKTSVQQFVASGLQNSPRVQVAALGDFKFDQLDEASNPLYLAESDEVQLTPAVKAQAAKLKHDPIKIYEWVNHNVDWIPTWGAMQSSDLTLSTMTGNSFDIASLTIALLRASKIPARYVHGTIDVPAAEYTDWVGNFANVDTASDFASAGGIPTITVTRRGKVAAIRMEHIWVEAAIDYLPSRGVKNYSADTWLQLDPSFKKFEQLGPVTGNFQKDYRAIRDAYLITGTVTNDWVQGLKPSAINASLQISNNDKQIMVGELQNKFNINYKNEYGSTELFDVLGGRKKALTSFENLPSSLPYEIKIIGVRFDKIPKQLQNEITLGFHSDIFGDIIDGVTLAYAKLNNENIKLDFAFNTKEDAVAMSSYIDEKATSLDQINTTIPSYLLKVVPIIRIGNKAILEGGAMTLGADLQFNYNVKFAGRRYKKYKSASIPAGSSIAIGIVGQVVDGTRLAKSSKKFKADMRALEGTVEEIMDYNPDLFQNIISDAYYTGMMEYYGKQMAVADAYTKGRAQGEIDLISAVGIMGYVPEVRYFFGMPRSISKGTIRVDVGHQLFNVRSYSNDVDENFNLSFMIGLYGSQLEATVPSKLFATSRNHSVGYSATVLLQYATNAGQKIYKLTSSNASLLNEINLSQDGKIDIRAALQTGKTVITHASPIGASAKYSGYVILDTITAEGAYILDNGTNGGSAELADSMMADCAYANRPGFVFRDNDRKWQAGAMKCAALARKMKIGALEDRFASIQAQKEAIEKFMSVYVKMPMVIADCMVAGAPLLLTESLIVIRTSAAMLSITTTLPGSSLYASSLVDLAEGMEDYVDFVWDSCSGL